MKGPDRPHTGSVPPGGQIPAQSLPVPCPDALTEPFWAACQDRRLVIQQCRRCGWFIHLPEPLCPRCRNQDLAWSPVRGTGQVLTWTVAHVTSVLAFAAHCPYLIALVELDDQRGLRMVANLPGTQAKEVHRGLPVKVCFVERSGFGLVPDFVPIRRRLP